jgi:predicted lysophospholipase L1 biosynthesis ABC-type transport system permease subunit
LARLSPAKAAALRANVVLTRQIGTQRGQIAALKALGCPDWRIGLHYLQYVLVIVLLGIAIGMVRPPSSPGTASFLPSAPCAPCPPRRRKPWPHSPAG